MEKFLIWKAKNDSFTKKFGQNIRFVPFDTVATSEHTVTDIQVAFFRGCLLLRLTDYLYDPNDESVRKILNISYQKIDSAIAYQDIDGKVKIASEGYNRAYIGDEVEAKNLELDWFDFASSEFTTKSINEQDEDEDSSDDMEDENESIPEDEVDEENVDSDDDEEETEPNEEDSETEEESDDEAEEEVTSSIDNEDDEKDEDANSDVQHELHENEDMDEVESWSTNDDLHDDEEKETPRAFVETDTKEKKAPSVAANKYRLNQEPAPNKFNKNKKNFKPKNNRMNNYNSSNRPNNNGRPANNNKQSSTIPLHNPVNRNSELLKRLMGL